MGVEWGGCGTDATGEDPGSAVRGALTSDSQDPVPPLCTSPPSAEVLCRTNSASERIGLSGLAEPRDETQQSTTEESVTLTATTTQT